MIETINLDQLDDIAPLRVKLNELHQELDEVCGNPRRGTAWEKRRDQLHRKASVKCLIQIVRGTTKPAGYCFTSIDGSNRGEIDSLYIVPERRGEGLGTTLVGNALQWLNDSECTEIEVCVHPGNTGAFEFYWGFGFAAGPLMKRVANQALNRMPRGGL